MSYEYVQYRPQALFHGHTLLFQRIPARILNVRFLAYDVINKMVTARTRES